MKVWIGLLILVCTAGTVFAADPLDDVYGTMTTACTQDADADTGAANLLGPLAKNKLFLIYCHDGAGAGVACECLLGTASVNASSSVGFTMFAGEKIMLRTSKTLNYISCLPFVDNQYYDVCQMN